MYDKENPEQPQSDKLMNPLELMGGEITQETFEEIELKDLTKINICVNFSLYHG